MEGKGEREVTASPRGWVAILLMTVLLSSFSSLLSLLTHLHTFFVCFQLAVPLCSDIDIPEF